MTMKAWPQRLALLGVVLMFSVLTLAGCGGGGSGNGGTGNELSGATLTVGSKKDPDSQLLGAMYAELLKAHGANVTSRLGLGQTPVLDSSIKSGQIDLYPEFTGTGIGTYKLQNSNDSHTLYNTVKDYYKNSLQITWLDPAYNLNDSYALCTTQTNASKYNLKTIADVQPIAGQLKLATQQDGVDFVVHPMEKAYNLKFKGDYVLLDQGVSYDAVKRGDADLMICYTTDPHIVNENFVILQDPKNTFPFYNPAPIVRDPTLQKYPKIADVLNPLAAKLTTEEQTKLIAKTSGDSNQKPEVVARQWLQQQGLIK